MTDIHVRPAVSCIEPYNRLPFSAYHRQVLHGEFNHLALLQIQANPNLISVRQNDLESLCFLGAFSVIGQLTRTRLWTLYR